MKNWLLIFYQYLSLTHFFYVLSLQATLNPLLCHKVSNCIFFRLSEMMGKQLKTNNPAITDLSDPSRPLNLVEKFSNLYDNEWTDAIEDVESITKDEWLASKILLTVVTVCLDLHFTTMKKFPKITIYISAEL